MENPNKISMIHELCQCICCINCSKHKKNKLMLRLITLWFGCFFLFFILRWTFCTLIPYPDADAKVIFRGNTVLLVVKVTAITTKLNEIRIFICIFRENCLPLSSFLLQCVLLVYGLRCIIKPSWECIKWLQLNGIVKSCTVGMHAGRLQSKYDIATTTTTTRRKNHLISLHTHKKHTSILQTIPMDVYLRKCKWMSYINKFPLHWTAFLPRTPRKFYDFLIFLT